MYFPLKLDAELLLLIRPLQIWLNFACHQQKMEIYHEASRLGISSIYTDLTFLHCDVEATASGGLSYREGTLSLW